MGAGSSGLSTCCLSLTEGPPLSNTTFPHVLPFITLLECDSAPAEGPEPWGSTEHGVEVVLAHLEAARTVAHHGGLYHTNAEVKLQGELLSPGILPSLASLHFLLRVLPFLQASTDIFLPPSSYVTSVLSLIHPTSSR